jgi:glutathione S-transferase
MSGARHATSRPPAENGRVQRAKALGFERGARRDYLAGERFTVADAYAGSRIGWGMIFGSIEKRPVFERYHEGLRRRPAWVRAQEIDDAHRPAQRA